MRLCEVAGCDKKHFCKGFCKAHFNRFQKGQDLTPSIKVRAPALLPKQHPFYVAWTNMKTRCDNPDSTQYKYYGGRGIIYDPRWKEFLNFHADMFETWHHELELDRKDTNGNYCFENCRWITHAEQSKNRNPKGYLND